MMDVQAVFAFVIVVFLLAVYWRLAHTRWPRKRYRLRQQSGWRLGWRIGPFWFW